MYVLSIYISTTFACAHIEQVELNYTGDWSVVFVSAGIEVFHYFEVNTRSKCYLVGRRTIVAVVQIQVSLFPVIVCSCSVCLKISSGTGSFTFSSSGTGKVDVGCDTTKELHHIVDTEVASVFLS